MNRIALVEDHARLAELVRQALQAAGIPTDVFHSMETAWGAMRDIPYGALVIDRGLPDGDGLTLVKRLRAANLATPCLMLTARDALHDRVEGLDSGADDYLAKPFPMEELVARTRALMRRPAQLLADLPSWGDIQLHRGEGRLSCGPESVTLAPAELQIMLSLMQHAGRTLRRSALEAAAWGLSEAVTPNALDVALHRLRRKLLAVGSRLQIANVRNHGYALRDN
ncbi:MULTISPECIES: response regulator transcription factor [Roseateles]|uniref:DNA-binding response OmpR family regulator n=1 Tax=Pelomonas aquatica TaxID=431058 RepID=A0ABU1Z4J6_9BURK|nr:MULTISPECIES: response regulator transcription factor [Roseateles]KQY81868.1 two-component system response regulator [Pelomonas sp. Root1444]MDR7295537.1 DNA-binding response OmpR family regulator [Pelomonas aquatica]